MVIFAPKQTKIECLKIAQTRTLANVRNGDFLTSIWPSGDANYFAQSLAFNSSQLILRGTLFIAASIAALN